MRNADRWRDEYNEEPSKMWPGGPIRGTLDTYKSRGWCRLEVFSALCPKRFRDGSWRPGPLGLRYYYHHSPLKTDGSAMGPPLWASSLLNPLEEGIVYTCCAKAKESGNDDHICDRPKISKIIGDIAATYVAYAASGSTEWDMTLDMDNLPEWIYEAAKSRVAESGREMTCNSVSFSSKNRCRLCRQSNSASRQTLKSITEDSKGDFTKKEDYLEEENYDIEIQVIKTENEMEGDGALNVVSELSSEL